MTVSQSLVLVLLISLWASSTGTDLASNSTILIILLIALIALSYVTNNNGNSRNGCYFNYQTPLNTTSFDNLTFF